jgi:NADH dehydrogenase
MGNKPGTGGKVVIIGGGFGGLHAARRLRSTDREIVLIDKANHHLFQPLLYQVATAALSPTDIAAPIRQVLRRQKNATVIMGEAARIDKEKREVHLSDGSVIAYDYLVVAVGVRPSYLGNDAWKAYARGLKTLDDALAIRENILLGFEKAETSEKPSDAKRYLTFVVIGGGPTGVEISGAIAEIAHKTMLRDFRRIDPEKTRIHLVEGLPHILPEFPDKLRDRAMRDLERLGVEVITGKEVTLVDRNGVQVGERFIESSNVIWAAGTEAPPLLRTLDVALNGQGRVLVEPDLGLPGHEEVFVIGDAASLAGRDGKPLPGLAPVAIQQAKYVAEIIKGNVPRIRRKPFSYFDKGTLATIGRGHAIAKIGRLKIQGMVAWLFWLGVHLMYIVLFRNRLMVLLNWGYSYFTGQRGARLIVSSRTEKNRQS